jgi:PAS domain S-box-containing protein
MLAVFVPIVVALVVGSTLLYSYRSVEIARTNGDIVRQIRSSITELNHMVFSYVAYREERPKQQFLAEYDSITRLIDSTRFQNQEQQRLLNDIRLDSQSIKDLFLKLVSNVELYRMEGNDKLFREIEERLEGQLLVRSRQADSNASLLRSLTDNDIRSALTRAVVFIFFVLVLTTFPLTVLLARTRRGITMSLTELRKGTEFIGAGNLDFIIEEKKNDEVGELARAFNQMTRDLKAVTASKADLEREIFERKKAEDSLRESEERWATTLASIGDAVIATDVDGRISFMNNVAEELTGWTLPEASTKLVAEIFNIINEHTRYQVENPVTKVLREGMIVSLANHTILVRKDGTEVPIDDSGAPIRDASGKTVGVVLVFRDITERKEAVNKLIKARDELEHQVEMRTNQLRQQAELLDLAHDAIILTDKDGIILFWSTGAGRTYGFSKEEAIGNITHNLLQTKSGIPVKDILGIVEREGRWEGELVHTCKEGKEVIVHSRWALRLNEVSGTPEIMEVNRDISERKRAERALMESEERYRVAIESASDGIAIVKGDEHVYVNARFAEMFGYKDANEVIGKPLLQTVHPDDLKMVSAINRMRQMGEPVPVRYEFRGIKKDGSLRYIEVSAARTHYRGEPVSLAYLRDITDYKNLEDQLRQSQKMEAIGTLAGGIAHDFNNILAAIIGFSEMVEEDLPPGDASIPHVQRVINAAYRGRELVQQILAFSRKTEHARHAVSISFVAKETIQLLRASIPTTIEIIFDNAATSDTILATPVEVQQVLLNLATNAALSMQEQGGILHIRISDTVVEPDAQILDSEIVPGEYVQLVVRDTGTGIAPDLMERIFEPYFTTREVGQGTGMGLAVVYGIVKSLHGSVTVESEPGVGSTFQILLPKVTTEKRTDAPLFEQSLTGKERVLFIDDEEFLVEWGQALLERMGYEVTAMNDSAEALETFSSDPSRFDLVITDQTMPRITGLNLARELLKIRPDIPVILCTGHSESITLEKLKEAGVREFLMKPLAKKDLTEVIRRVLDLETKK